MAVSVPRRLFTVDEYYEMARVGILKPDERVELLDGEIVPMNPIGSPHAWCVNRLMEAFAPLLGRIRLSVQNPLRLADTSEPEPDIVLLRPETPQDRHPGPADALLVIEVADASIKVDRGRKLALYARAGIADYWIVDLNAGCVEVFREPHGRRYRAVSRHAAGATISPLHLPDIAVAVSAILGV
ncbi:MAG: Uma2 family endonuclease [Solirubrobacterales bacterium]|nr:Uma2 family endonuclease [Solirubrobacterales bacterium]